MRLFVAIEMPPSIKEELSGLCHGFPRVRWNRPEQMHLTLRFIGEVEEGALEELCESLSQVEHGPLELQLRGVGQFLRNKQTDVLWVAVDGGQRLRELQTRIERAIRALGFRSDRKPFHPHVTLARLKNTPETRVGHWLDQFRFFESEPFMVREFTLFRSVLHPGGARHTVEEVFPLDAGVERLRIAD